MSLPQPDILQFSTLEIGVYVSELLEKTHFNPDPTVHFAVEDPENLWIGVSEQQCFFNL